MTEREPGREGRENRTSPRATPQVRGSERTPDRSGSDTDEQTLFNPDPSRRLFGEGSYAEGGQNQEGNFEEREVNPHGNRGSFDDAGGYGGKELLGGKSSDEAAERSRKASDEKTGPDESIEDS